MLRLVAVDDNPRRPVPPLVCIAQLDPPALVQRRRVLLHGAFQHGGQLRRGHLAHGAVPGLSHGAIERSHPRAVLGRDEVDP